MMATKLITESIPRRIELAGWFRRLGWIGFLFFFAKGLLWLTLPAILVYFGVG